MLKLFLFSFILNSCNEKPSDLGFTLLFDTIAVYPVTSSDIPMIVKTQSLLTPQICFNSGAMFLGSANGTRAIICLRFQNIPDTLAYLKPEDIEICELHMFPNRYTFGDSVDNSLVFNIYRVNKLWTVQATYDSLMNPPPPNEYIDGKVLATFDSKIVSKDTMEKIKINIDKELVIDWFKMYADSVLRYQIWGIALIPDFNRTTVIRQFSSQAIGLDNFHPYIRVIYKNRYDKTDTLIMNSAMDASWVETPFEETSNITIMGGVSIKSKIYIDVSFLPKLSSIHKAELRLTLNKEQSLASNYGLDSVIACDFFLDSVVTDSSKAYRTYEGQRIRGDYYDTYVFPSITSAIQIWNRLEGRGSLVLRPVNYNSMYRKLDKLVFYGFDHPDVNLRPKLILIYSKHPDYKKN